MRHPALLFIGLFIMGCGQTPSPLAKPSATQTTDDAEFQTLALPPPPGQVACDITVLYRLNASLYQNRPQVTRRGYGIDYFAACADAKKRALAKQNQNCSGAGLMPPPGAVADPLLGYATCCGNFERQSTWKECDNAVVETYQLCDVVDGFQKAIIVNAGKRAGTSCR